MPRHVSAPVAASCPPASGANALLKGKRNVTVYDLQHQNVDTTLAGQSYEPLGWPSIQRVSIAVVLHHWWITLFPFAALHIAGLM